ncbi:acetylcholinesterase-like isoform X1 [Acanthaster planci]|uniref:Carboxylic ester hydrolase n=1 Tax=Acanthaster planci TaxID=133434 RepID=A0A8B7Z581_ACAPL|nr:acetylcholinesterase-like isoform X1 [Acanthaster planci]
MQVVIEFVLCAVFLIRMSSGEDPPVVTTSQGRIVGTKLQFAPEDPALRRSVDAYLGVPYAEAPVGPLRFKPPVAKSWSGDLQATKLGNRCPQPVMPIGNITMTGPFNEDCLVLDIFVPKPVPPKAAVLLFIHGGGYTIGAGTMLEIYSTPIAALGDVIVVAPNYRLGVLGFLSTGDEVVPGNMGLLDQRLAMEWVRDNIAAFGGDPQRVAIFGESAGSSSVSLHMVSPGSAGLFRGAIMQSGDATSPWAFLPSGKGRSRAFALGKLVGCEEQTSAELLECLQKVEDLDVFVQTQYEKMMETVDIDEMMTFQPIADGDVIPFTPAELYAEGAINDAVSIIGSLADEGMMMLLGVFPNITDEAPNVDSGTFELMVQSQLAWLLTREPIVAEAVTMFYRDTSCREAPNCDQLDSLSQVVGDASFICPGERAAKAFVKAGRKVYRYHMTHEPSYSLIGKKWTKATHGDDLPFVFGLPFVPSANWSFTEDEARMSKQIINYWANLAKTGNPNLSSLDGEQREEEKLPEWPLFTVEELAYKDLSPSMENGRGIKAKECIMWNEFLPQLLKTAEEAKKCEEAPTESSSKDSADKEVEQGTCTKENCPED